MSVTLRSEPTLSVFMSNYNHAVFLSTALDAILAQTVRPDRIYIVDDASTDGSRAVIERYALRYPDIIVPSFVNDNRGCIPNVNEWLKSDRSEFIFIAAADDQVFPTLFEESLAMLRQFPKAGVCSAHSRYMDQNGTDLGRFQSWGPLHTPGYIDPRQAERFLIENDSWFIGTTTVYRRSALQSVCLDPDLGGFADGFACRVIALRDGACFIPHDLACWRVMQTGMAAQDLAIPSSVHRVLTRATTLMEGPYRNLFSDKHIRRWNKRWLFWAVITTYDLPSDQRNRVLDELLRPFSKTQKNILRAFALLAFGPRHMIGKLAAFLYLRPFDLISALKRAYAHRFS